MNGCPRCPQRAVALVWDGTRFVTEGGSDTGESDSEQPLTESQQVVAILDLKSDQPPPLPIDSKHALSTATAVLHYVTRLSSDKRTHAHQLALRTSLEPFATVRDWIRKQYFSGRKEATIKAALCWALNPNRTQPWICKKAAVRPSQATVAKGLALHLRMHPFTRSEVQHEFSAYQNWIVERDRRVGTLVPRRNGRTLDAAVALVELQRNA